MYIWALIDLLISPPKLGKWMFLMSWISKRTLLIFFHGFVTLWLIELFSLNIRLSLKLDWLMWLLRSNGTITKHMALTRCIRQMARLSRIKGRVHDCKVSFTLNPLDAGTYRRRLSSFEQFASCEIKRHVWLNLWYRVCKMDKMPCRTCQWAFKERKKWIKSAAVAYCNSVQMDWIL